ncbi:DUF2326 domain-containing protein [Candidatus Filomicrobium marinum]|nr:DUF2326 domain-containing protein [Candidatus Filomicrobium marinum]
MLLAGRDPKFFLLKHSNLFNDFVFFLEIQLFDGTFVTIRRSVAEVTKISFKKHETAGQDYNRLPESGWDHSSVAFDRSKEILDGLLDWRSLKPYDFRKGLGYQLRSQDDYRDVFQLRRFAGGHADWKPYLAHVLGFNSELISKRYEKEKRLKERKATAQTLKHELGDSVDDISKVDGLLLLKRQEVEKKQILLDAFDFRNRDRQANKQLVDELDEQIAALNSKRYSLTQSRKKIVASLEEDAIMFNPDEAAKLFQEAGILFHGQIKRDYEQLIAFNRAITDERRQYLIEERNDIDTDLKRITAELNSLGKLRSETLSFLTSADVFAKYKRASDELATLKAEILDLNRQRDLLLRLQLLATEIRRLSDEIAQLRQEIDADVNNQHNPDTLFSRIRLLFNEIVEEVIDRKAILSVHTNKEGHLEFKAEILDESGNSSSADAGFTYRKLLCIAFDLAVLRCHLEDKFPRFVFHDGVFESLDPRKKVKLLGEIRRLANEGLQPVITLIDAELPSGDAETVKLEDAEIILTLHDEGDDGRLFRMPPW